MKVKEKIVKSNIMIEKLLKVVKEELENLPDKSIFGDSNDETKAESRVWIQELESALEGKLIINDDSEVYWWLVGDNDTLSKDYEVEEC